MLKRSLSSYVLPLAAATLIAGLALAACGDDSGGGGSDATCRSETVAGLARYTSDRDSADICVVIDGYVAYRSTNQCRGGYYLRDSASTSAEPIYLSLGDLVLDSAAYPQSDTAFRKVRVQASFRPGENLCTELLCQCQRKLAVERIDKR